MALTRTRLRPIFYNRYPKFGCGAGIFFIQGCSRFKEACTIHDIDYDAQGPILTRCESDCKLLCNMLACSGNSLWRIARARVYYAIVRIFGRLYFKKSTNLPEYIIQELKARGRFNPLPPESPIHTAYMHRKKAHYDPELGEFTSPKN